MGRRGWSNIGSQEHDLLRGKPGDVMESSVGEALESKEQDVSKGAVVPGGREHGGDGEVNRGP